MANITLSADAVKAVARRIKKIAPDLKHSQIIEEIAQGFGWKGDALMHALKSGAPETAPRSEKTEIDRINELKDWIGDQLPTPPSPNDSEFEHGLFRIWLDIKFLISKMEAGTGNDKRRGVKSDGVWESANLRQEVAALGGEEKSADEIVEEMKRQLASVKRVDENAVERLLGKPRETDIQPADSVERDYVVCLVDGAKKKMMSRHILAKYGLSKDQYRKLFGLPDWYPFMAPAYVRSKLDAKIDDNRDQSD